MSVPFLSNRNMFFPDSSNSLTNPSKDFFSTKHPGRTFSTFPFSLGHLYNIFFIKPATSFFEILGINKNGKAGVIHSLVESLNLQPSDCYFITDTVGDIIDGKVVRAVKGGYIVDTFGVEAFLPMSLSAFKGHSNNDIVNHKFKFLVAKMNKPRRNLILSRREIMQKEREEVRQRADNRTDEVGAQGAQPPGPVLALGQPAHDALFL